MTLAVDLSAQTCNHKNGSLFTIGFQGQTIELYNVFNGGCTQEKTRLSSDCSLLDSCSFWICSFAFSSEPDDGCPWPPVLRVSGQLTASPHIEEVLSFRHHMVSPILCFATE